MLYHLLVPLAKDHIVFNVFRYLTFRSLMALISALVISLVIGPWIIRRLRELQHGGETIREDTPERHRLKKGTPTMGGSSSSVRSWARRSCGRTCATATSGSSCWPPRASR